MHAHTHAHTRTSNIRMCLQLVGGQLVQVPPALVKRQKQHFHTLEAVGGCFRKKMARRRRKDGSKRMPLLYAEDHRWVSKLW